MANLGPLTLEQVGEQLGLTRERVRQVEEQALRKVRGRSMSINQSDEVTAARELREAGEP
jgi:DNA-directed RNA polymerase sigma subunit (sigma70/sigma32)